MPVVEEMAVVGEEWERMEEIGGNSWELLAGILGNGRRGERNGRLVGTR